MANANARDEGQQPVGIAAPTSRRGLLAGALGLGTLAGAAMLHARQHAPPNAPPHPDDGSQPRGGGYRLTDHVRRYYQLARF